MDLQLRFELNLGCCFHERRPGHKGYGCCVDMKEMPISQALRKEGRKFIREFDGIFLVTPESRGKSVRPRLDALEAKVRPWLERVRAELGAEHTLWVPGDLFPMVPDFPLFVAPDPNDDPELYGYVTACFTDEAARQAASAGLDAELGEGGVARWDREFLAQRAEEPRTAEQLLRRLEQAPGFLGGWWLEDPDGETFLVSGDPMQFTLICFQQRNWTGFANFLREVGARRVHLHPDLVREPWQPGPRHTAGDAGEDLRQEFEEAWAEGRLELDDFIGTFGHEFETHALFYHWDRGGGAGGWPAHLEEALTRAEFRRESFTHWTRPSAFVDEEDED